MNIEELILLVEKNEEIYDAKHPKHRNRDFVAGVWKSIATKLNATDVEVRAKWQNLRSNYMREKRKLKDTAFGSTRDSKSTITWPYFKLLSFLDPTLKHKTTSGNVPDVDVTVTEENFEEYVYLKQELSQEPQQEFQQKTTETNSAGSNSQNATEVNEKRKDCENLECRKKKRRRINETDDEINKEYLKHLSIISKRVEDDNDADRMFLISLLPSIKKLGPIENLDFKAEVITLLKKKLELTSTSFTLNSPSVASSDSNYSRPYSGESMYISKCQKHQSN